MKNFVFRSTALAMIAMVVALSFNTNIVLATDAVDMATEETFNAQTVLENDKYVLHFNPDNAYVSVTNKSTGYVWHTNPNEINEDEDTNSSQIKSQILVNYYMKNIVNTMDSYSQCIALGNELNWNVDDNKLFVEYSIGEQSISADMMPQVISKKRMENEVLSKLNDEEKEKLLKRYKLYETSELEKEVIDSLKLTFPSITEQDIYIRGKIPIYELEELYALFQKADYDFEDLQYDCDDNSVENTYEPSPSFNIELIYSLKNDGFSVSVNPEKITYNDSFKPIQITLLPYFGAMNEQETGYMLVPDGCGAVIEFNNEKISEDDYWKKFFELDPAFAAEQETSQGEVSVLPYFASSNSNAAFLATIDSGYEAAGVSADISGKINNYNYISAFFTLFPSDVISLSSHTLDKFVTYGKDMISDEISISYHLYDEPQNYSQLAVSYRELLTENDILPNNTVDVSVLDVNFIGTAEVTEKFLGIPYNSTAILTSYKNAAEILNSYLQDIKTNVNFVNSLKGGRLQQSAEKIQISSKLGSKKDLKQLEETANKVSYSFNAIYAESIRKSDKAVKLNNSLIRTYDYNVSNGKRSASAYFVVSPLNMVKYADKLAKQLSKNAELNINITDAGYILASDFNPKSNNDICKSRENTEAYLKTLSSKTEITADKGSYYSLKYLKEIKSIPTECSNYGIEDYAVPFYQIVVSGSLDYSVDSINESVDSRNQFLKAVETGARLQYTWIYDKPSNISSQKENYYGYDYKSSISEAANYIKEYKELANKISGSKIIEHIRLSDDVIKVVWDNEIVVYVNYSDVEQTVGEVTVAAKSFTIGGTR